MNFDESVAAHTRWKARLRAALDGVVEALDPATVARDDACDLGRWIHGDGDRYKALAEHQVLLAAHARFHQCAAEVVTKKALGMKAEAETLMANKGDFSRTSTETISAIMAMQRAVLK